MIKSIQGRLLVASLLLILLAMAVTGVYLLQALSRYYLDQYEGQMAARGELIGHFVARYLDRPRRPEDLSALIQGFGEDPGVETLVLNRRGVVLGEAGTRAGIVSRRLVSPQILRALDGEEATAYVSGPGGAAAVELALPLKSAQGQTVGVVDVRGSLAGIFATLARVREILLAATAMALVVSGLLAVALARTIARPIRGITAAAEQVAGGDYDLMIPVSSQDEVGALARMFNNLIQRLRETIGQMRSETERLEAVLRYMTDGVLAMDGEDRVIVVNPAACRIMNWDEDAVLGRPLAEVWPEWGETRGAEDRFGVAVHRVTLPGNRLVAVRFAPLYALQGGTVAVIQDVTEETRLDALRKEFVSNVSHELRTPLTTMKSYVETLLEGNVEDPEVAKRFLTVLSAETDRMVRLVADLLDLSRLDEGSREWDMRPISLPRLVEACRQRLEIPITRKGIAFSAALPANLPQVRGQYDRMQQVFLNLIGNAVEFTPPGGQVRVTGRRQGQHVIVQVEDTGIGIPEEDLPRVFERFYRVDKARSRELGGTGLGLAIAKEIVEAHGGDLRLLSHRGQGTVARVELPVGTS